MTYRVRGMTCEHCVAAVTAAIGALASVVIVDVDLEGGTVTVTSERPLTRTPCGRPLRTRATSS